MSTRQAESRRFIRPHGWVALSSGATASVPLLSSVSMIRADYPPAGVHRISPPRTAHSTRAGLWAAPPAPRRTGLAWMYSVTAGAVLFPECIVIKAAARLSGTIEEVTARVLPAALDFVANPKLDPG